MNVAVLQPYAVVRARAEVEPLAGQDLKFV